MMTDEFKVHIITGDYRFTVNNNNTYALYNWSGALVDYGKLDDFEIGYLEERGTDIHHKIMDDYVRDYESRTNRIKIHENLFTILTRNNEERYKMVILFDFIDDDGIIIHAHKMRESFLVDSIDNALEIMRKYPDDTIMNWEDFNRLRIDY